MNFKELIRNVPDFPKEGIQFKDITTLVKDRNGFREAIDWIAALFKDKSIDKVIAIESRGFIVGAPVAVALGAGMVLIRKKGKLPYRQVEVTYELEYGTDTLCIHEDAINRGENILIVDDLLATGGTVRAMIDLVKQLSGNLTEIAFLVELEFLNGRTGIDVPVFSIIKYSEE